MAHGVRRMDELKKRKEGNLVIQGHEPDYCLISSTSCQAGPGSGATLPDLARVCHKPSDTRSGVWPKPMTERYSKSQDWDRLGKAWEGLGCILAPESDDDAGSTGLASPLEAEDIYFNSTQVQTFIVKVRKFVQFDSRTHSSRSLCPYRIAATYIPGSCCLPPIEGSEAHQTRWLSAPFRNYLISRASIYDTGFRRAKAMQPFPYRKPSVSFKTPPDIYSQ